MANGAFKFKDNSGNVVSFISGSGANISFSGGTLDLSGMTGLTLGNLTLSGTTQNAISASHAANYLLTSSFNSYTGTTNTIIGTLQTSSGSLNTYTSSNNTIIGTLQTSTGSLNTFTSSATTRLNTIEGVTGSYATTGSNRFSGDQTVTGSLTVTGFIDAQELRTTYISSSILYRSGSTKFGDELSDTHAFTGSMLVSGSISVPGSGLVSGSSQIVYSGLTGTPSGIISGSAQVVSALPSGTVSGSVQVTLSSTTGYGSVLNQAVLTTSSPTFSGGTLTGALSGTSATFSSNFYVSGGTITNVGNGIHAFYESNYAQIQLNGVNGSLIDFSVSGTDYRGRIIYDNTSNSFQFNTNGTNNLALVLTSTGAATFSSSVTATGGLTIGSLGSGSDAILTLATNASGSPRTIYYKASTATINFTGTGGTDLMTLTNGGSLGIGTNAPQSIFHIGAAATAFAGVKSYTGLANSYEGFIFDYYYNTSANNLRVFDIVALGYAVNGAGGSDIRFLTVPQTTTNTPIERMRITSGGNVLVGTTTDAGYKLDVNGTGRFSGQLKSIASGGYSAGTEQLGAGIVDSTSTLSGVRAALRLSNNGGGYITKIILSDNSLNDCNIWFTPSAATVNNLFQIGVASNTPQFTINGSGAATFSSTITNRGVVVQGASGGYTTGDNTYINFGAGASPDTFGAINVPYGDKMKFNSYHGFDFKTSNSTASPVTMLSIGISGAATFSSSVTANGQVTVNATIPFSLIGNGNAGTYTQTAIYANQNNTSNNTANGIFIERGRITDSSSAEIRSFVIGDRGGGIQLLLDKDGKLTVTNDIVAYGSPSDISLKTNIKPLKNSLDKIMKLQGVSFTWKENTSENNLIGIKDDIGFIAQEVQEILPDLVRKNDNGLLSLRDKGITALLVEAIKEQQKQIDELKNLTNGITK